MFFLGKAFRFEAAHYLPEHDGKCRELHGHSWHGKVILAGPTLHTEGPKRGMLIDFSDISSIVDGVVLAYLDHKCLNASLEQFEVYPTSENVARWIYNRVLIGLIRLALVRQQPHYEKLLYAVSLCETCTSEVIYTEQPGIAFS